jgi:NADPH:quinone reductase
VNRQITLVGQPSGPPKESDFRIVESPIPRAGAGEVLVRALYLSVDPEMRGRTSLRPIPQMMGPGEVVQGGVVGQVVESNDPRMAPNDIVEGSLGWQEYATAHAKALRKVDPDMAPIPTALSALGMPGLTAYFGLLDVCRPQPGETVLISGASGATGTLVGQIARIKRCRVVGITSSANKVRFLTGELGFDAAFDYHGASDFQARLKEVCPNGIDIYFDNIGGSTTDEVIRSLNTRARVALCGQAPAADPSEPQLGPRWLDQLTSKQIRMEGFQVTQFSTRFEDGLRQMAIWLHQGKIRYEEVAVEGIENAPKAFLDMVAGQTIASRVVKVAA